MRRGAPYEAERALASAMDRLEEPERSEAVIQLAKALNEQGKYSESLQLLERSRPLASEDQEAIAQILTILGGFKVSARPLEQEECDRSELIAIARASGTDSTKAHAITIASRVLPENETPRLNRELLEVMFDIGEEELDLESRGALALAKGRALYREKDLSAGRDEIDRAVDKLSTKGLTSSTLVGLLTASAILATASGDYSSALVSLKRAWCLSIRLANDSLCGSVAGNLAVCHGRLGNFAEQIDWCRTALDNTNITKVPNHTVVHTSMLALGYALIGNFSEAIETLEEGGRRLASCQNRFVHQEWCLYCADTLRLVGEHERADRKATEAGVSSNEGFLVTNVVGKYARWTAIRGVRTDPEPARRRLEQLMNHRVIYDRLDQIEILNAKVWFDCRVSVELSKDRELLESELVTMPAGVTILLEKLGMLNLLNGEDKSGGGGVRSPR
jgi:tetratricopeptide (TPR) repeat protein